MELFSSWKRVLTDDAQKKDYTAYIESTENRIHSLLETGLDKVSLCRDDSKPLCNVPYVVKDNIAVKDFRLTCGSRILENLNSPYNATAVERLSDAGAQVVAKANLDEFGMGSSTDNSALATSNNPFDVSAVCGGSSGGSAAAVAAGLVPFSLGSDTGGSVRQPAAFCGCLGLKPTYGTISRYGLVAYASSLEVIGVLGRDVDEMSLVYRTAASKDERDQSSISRPQQEPSTEVRKVGIYSQMGELSPAIQKSFDDTVATLEKAGIEIVTIDIPALEYVVPAYYTIATAEASANLARYTGVRYGHRSASVDTQEQMVAASRNEGFGDEVKLRILLGTYVLRSGFQDQYYIRAQKIRTAIRNGFVRAFEDVDLILSPVFPSQAFRRGDEALTPFQQKKADQFTASANLAGIPALAFPTGMADGLPAGMQFLAPDFGEYRMFEMLKKIPELSVLPEPPGFDSAWRK